MKRKLIIPDLKYLLAAVTLTIVGYLFQFLPGLLDESYPSIDIVLIATSNIMFYVGVTGIILYMLTLCTKIIISALVPDEAFSKASRLNLKWNWTMSGLTLLLFAFALQNFPIPSGADTFVGSESAISSITTPLFYIGIGLISSGILYTNIQGKVVSFWREEVLTKLRDNIDEVSRKYISAVRTETLQEAIHQSDESDAKGSLSTLISKVYGEHCTKDQGLFESLRVNLFPFLENSRVHRSNYIKKISINEAAGKHRWDETCEFNLHCIKLDPDYVKVNDGQEVDYELRYNPSMRIEGSPTTIQDFWDLEIRIFHENDKSEVIFDSKQALKFNDAKDKIICSGKPEADIKADYDLDARVFSFSFSKKITLKKAFTKIQLRETSHLPENYFTLSTIEPSCGMDIDIHLPSGWFFEEHNVFNKNRSWSVSTHPSNRLSLHNSGWILPGIIMNCRWDSAKQKEMFNNDQTKGG